MNLAKSPQDSYSVSGTIPCLWMNWIKAIFPQIIMLVFKIMCQFEDSADFVNAQAVTLSPYHPCLVSCPYLLSSLSGLAFGADGHGAWSFLSPGTLFGSARAVTGYVGIPTSCGVPPGAESLKAATEAIRRANLIVLFGLYKIYIISWY